MAAYGQRLSSKVILGDKRSDWPALPDVNVALALNAHCVAIKVLNQQIARIERAVTAALKPRPEYQMLRTVFGVGPILAWTIVLSPWAVCGNHPASIVLRHLLPHQRPRPLPAPPIELLERMNLLRSQCPLHRPP